MTDRVHYTVRVDPKSLRETLCIAQNWFHMSKRADREAHAERLGLLIDECDRHRPIGPDGKHDDRHTPTCGCEDKSISTEPEMEICGSTTSTLDNEPCVLEKGHATAVIKTACRSAADYKTFIRKSQALRGI